MLREVVDVTEFGTDTASFHLALGAARRVFIPPGVYHVNINLAHSKRALTGSDGAVLVSADDASPVITITGSGNLIQDIEIAQEQFIARAITLAGHDNCISGLVVHGPERPSHERYWRTSATELYGPVAVQVEGGSLGSMVKRCELYNWRGRGIEILGLATVQECSIHDCWGGIFIATSSANGTRCVRNTILDNDICLLDTFPKAGCDGILVARDVSSVLIDQNLVSKSERPGAQASAEHGIYFQGARGIISNNIVQANPRDGIKLNHGARDTVISGNHTSENGSVGIRLEADSVATQGNNQVAGNFCAESDSIHCTYGSGNTKLHGKLTVVQNHCRGSMSVRSEDNVLVANNHVGDVLRIGGQSGKVLGAGSVVSGNSCKGMHIAQTTRCIVAINNIETVITMAGTAQGVKLSNNIERGQEVVAPSSVAEDESV